MIGFRKGSNNLGKFLTVFLLLSVGVLTVVVHFWVLHYALIADLGIAVLLGGPALFKLIFPPIEQQIFLTQTEVIHLASAPFWRRVGAFLVDSLFFLMIAVVPVAFVQLVLYETGLIDFTDILVPPKKNLFAHLSLLCFLVLLALRDIGRLGVGKGLFTIKAFSLDTGGPLSVKLSIKRNVLFLLYPLISVPEQYSNLFILLWFTLVCGPFFLWKRTLGDRFANTQVYRFGPQERVRLLSTAQPSPTDEPSEERSNNRPAERPDES